MKKINTNILVNMLVPVLWIVVFFFTKYKIGRIDYGDVNLFLWIALPIGLFIYNTLSEIKIKKLGLLYIMSTSIQVLGVAIHIFLYYNFIGSDPETSAVGILIIILTTMLNLVLSLIGIGIKSIILKFKK